MKGSTVIFFILATTAAADPDFTIQPRMIGGVTAPVGSLPFVASFRRERNGLTTDTCLATIISETWLLSAALCVQYEDVHYAVIYTNTYEHTSPTYKKPIHPNKIIIHPEFNPITGKNDLALIHLLQPLVFTDDVKAIQMSRHQNNSNVTAVGWNEDVSTGLEVGIPEDYALGTIDLIPIDIQTCEKEFPEIQGRVDLDDKQMCAHPGQGYDMCGVDSGSPWIDDVSEKIIGVFSDVLYFAAGHNHMCNPEHNHPLVCTLLWPYRNWIKAVTGIDFN